MEIIEDLSKAIIILIDLGIVLRVIFLIVSALNNPDEIQINKKRIVNAVIFMIFANGIYVLKDLILKYYI